MQCDLDASAQRGAVHRGECRIGQGTYRGQKLVSCLSCRTGARGVDRSGNSVMSAPAANTNGLPVSTRPHQSSLARAGQRAASDSSAARPNVVRPSASPRRCPSSRARPGPPASATRCRWNCVGASTMTRVLPEHAPHPCRTRCTAPSVRSARVAAARTRRRAVPSAARRSRRADARRRLRRRTDSAAGRRRRRPCRHTMRAPARRTAR